MDEYIPLGDTRYVFRISKYNILTKKKAIQNATEYFWWMNIYFGGYSLRL